MYNCIFTPHCMEESCDMSCPKLVQSTYLLERNNIDMNSSVFRSSSADISKALHYLDLAEGHFKVVQAADTVKLSELITYCAICKNWKGSRLHCTVYNLKYSKFIDETKKSWSTRSEPESLEYMRIFSQDAKVLIISNLDYVNFGDFESQTLLSLIQERSSESKTTIIVSPNLRNLIGKSGTAGITFFDRLRKILSEAVIDK